MQRVEVLSAIDEWLERKLSAESKSAEDMAQCMRVFAEHGRDLAQAIAYAEHLFKQDGSITLTTGHKAKGLEWPIVVLPDLTAAGRDQGTAVRFDRVAGLGLKPPASDEGELQSLSVERIAEIRHARTTAERLRLLYVAMTRARDRVVLGRMPGAPRQGSWASDLAPVLAWADVREQTEELDVATLPVGALPRDQVLALPEALAQTTQALERVRHSAPATAQTAVLPVTALQDFVSCPRRYHYAHQVGLSERPHLDVWRDDGAEATDVRERGTAAHRLIELTPLDAVCDTLSPTLLALRRAEGLDDVAGPDEPPALYTLEQIAARYNVTITPDDVVISSFATGPKASTLPIVIFSSVRLGVSPKINALATILVGVVALGAFVSWFAGRRSSAA